MLKINGEIFGDEEFRNKEAVYKKPKLNTDINTITLLFESNKDIANLAMAHSYLNIHAPEQKKLLLMPYLPYSRMDREINDQIFSLRYFADILNNMSFEKILLADPHSKVSSDLINNLEELNIEDIILDEILPKIDIDFIMFPDKGAKEKYTKKYLKLCKKHKVIYGQKKRDLSNRGKIKEYSIIAEDIDLKDKSVLIIDDLCSFGNTFKHASSALKSEGVDKIYLFVTHTENTIFQGELLDSSDIEKVFTTNSILRSQSHPKLLVIDIF
ncbi:hypothetical protein [Acetoanaerobium noterae]|uniref:hypothetical protein n=1 Tax=Acetoanaerobium noterae TaxID=745369 RepID=UPI0033410E60